MNHRIAFLALLASPLPLVAQTPPVVPYTAIQITGSKGGQAGPSVTYRAYQAPGEPFRIVCQEPCSIASDLIDAAYQGFKLVRPEIVSLMGVGIRSELTYYDIHLNNDTYCGIYTAGVTTGDAGRYFPANGVAGVASCFWDYEKSLPQPAPYLPSPFTVSELLSRPRQLLRTHEYGHGLFFGRHEFSYEDFVKALSFNVAGINGVRVTEACDPYLKDYSQGRLVYALCRSGGFQWSQMAPAMLEMDRLFSNALGTGNPNQSSIAGRSPTSVQQLNVFLPTLTGRDTTDAFIASGVQPPYVGGTGTLLRAGGFTRLAGGADTLFLRPNALASDASVELATAYSTQAAPPNFTFNLLSQFRPESLAFSQPARLTMTVEPAVIPAALAEESLRLYRSVSGSPYAEVPGLVVDPVTHSVTALVSGLGTYILAGPSQASSDPATAVVATVASTPGLNGSYFRTQVQLHNLGTGTATGKLVFHPKELPATPNDPSLDFSLRFRETKSYADIFATLNQTGSGSLDILVTGSNAVASATRVFNDGGTSGTSGVSEDALPPGAALKAGQRGTLLGPTDVVAQRMNIGVRSLAAGATFTVTVHSAAGAVRKTLSKSVGASTYRQQSESDFLEGFSPASNDSIEIAMSSGSAFIYAATADNVSNDPSLQIARAAGRPGRNELETLTLPTVASTPGQFGSFFRTSVQLHNPTSSPLTGKLVFHVAGTSATPGDPSLAYTLAAYETKSYPDLLPALGKSGSGSVDAVPSAGAAPLVLARVFNDGGSTGTTGLSYEALSYFDALRAGQRGVLLAPPSFATQRLNIGVRTLSRGANVTIILRPAVAFGNPLIIKRDYAADFFEQKSATDFLEGRVLTGNESIEVTVEGGALFLYGAIGDNLTNDPTLQLPARASF
ncbi:MAG: hypothetical protein ABIT01_10265 [Thermoanaerobaculia bacterium]